MDKNNIRLNRARDFDQSPPSFPPSQQANKIFHSAAEISGRNLSSSMSILPRRRLTANQDRRHRTYRRFIKIVFAIGKRTLPRTKTNKPSSNLIPARRFEA